MKVKLHIRNILLHAATLCITACLPQEGNFQHKIKDYDDPSDYRMSTKEEFESFLGKYYSKMKLQNMTNVRSKQQLIDGYVINKNLPDFLIPWNIKNLTAYNKVFNEQTTAGFFNFHLARKKHATKTLIYMHDQLTSVTLAWDFLVEFSDYFPDINLVMIDSTVMSRSNKIFSTDEANLTFEKELKSFLKDFRLADSEIYLNIICHSFLLTDKFIKKNQSLYEKLIYYTPLVSKSQKDMVLDPSLLFEPGKKTYSYSEMSNLWQIPRGHNQRTKFIPKKHYTINLKTEINLMKGYYENRDLKGIKKAWLIYPEREDTLTAESMHLHYFKPENVYELKGMYHNDYYTHKEKRVNYFKLIKHIIEEV